MPTISCEDAKTRLFEMIDRAAAGEFVTITRHGEPAAVIVSVGAAKMAKKALQKNRSSLVEYLKSFPAELELDDDVFARNSAPSGHD